MSQITFRDYAAMLSDAFLPYQESVPDEVKADVQKLVKEFAENSSDMFSKSSRRTMLYLIAFADDDTRKQLFNLSYSYFDSPDRALTIFYEDMALELQSDTIKHNATMTKSILFSVAALDKEAKSKQLVNLMSTITDDQRGYMRALETIHKLPVSAKKRDFS